MDFGKIKDLFSAKRLLKYMFLSPTPYRLGHYHIRSFGFYLLGVLSAVLEHVCFPFRN